MTEIVISSAARTAVGSYGKSLKGVPPTQLGVIAAKSAIERAAIEPAHVDHVVFGNVIHTDTRDPYMARVVGIESGIPLKTPAYTVKFSLLESWKTRQGNTLFAQTRMHAKPTRINRSNTLHSAFTQTKPLASDVMLLEECAMMDKLRLPLSPSKSMTGEG